MKTMKWHKTTIMILGALSMAPWALWSGAQDRPQQERPLRYEAAAIVKLVPVRVLGADGRPVMDLRKEDFTLYEDGQKKTITEFEVHAITEAGMVVTPKLAGAVEAAVKPASEMNRKFFLFLDVQRSDPEGRQKAVAVAERFLETQVRPGDEVGLLGFYSMSGFFIKEYLTTDIARVRRAIESVTEAPPSPGEWVVMDFSVGAHPGGHVPDAGDASGMPFVGYTTFVPGTAAFQKVDFVPRMVDLVEAFKTIPGNKSLILFSSRNIGPEVGKLFGATGTAVYAINTQDWMLLRTGDKVKHIWWDHPLKDMAAASGGKYFADINQVAMIAQDLQALTGNFYVLGYYVKESWEGKYHKIRVEVARPTARVLVQDGYADAKPFTRMTDFEKDLQLLDLVWSERPASNPLPIAIDPLSPAAGTGAQACFLARLEVGAKTGPPASKSEIVILLRDKAGAQILSRRWVVDLGRYDGQIIFPYLITPVPTGTCDMRLAVRDLSSGEACVGRARLDVAATPQEGIVLSSLLLFETGAEAVFMKLPVPSKEKAGPGEGSLIDFYQMIPKGYHPVVSEIAAGAQKLIVILPFELRPARPEDKPILSVETKLISRADGVETPLEITVRDHKVFEGKPDILVADIMFPAIVPGRYDLEITVEDVGTNRRVSTRKPLVVR
jgi:VWFA-related protein